MSRDMVEDKKISDAVELLLKGGKMLGFHCNECDTPLFEMESNVFCPHCQKKYRIIEKDGTKVVEPAEESAYHIQSHDDAASAEWHEDRKNLAEKLEALLDKIVTEALKSNSIHDVKELVGIMKEITEILKELES